MTAYNYKTQEWMTGESGRLLLIEQVTETLNLLSSDNGHDYAIMVGRDRHEYYMEMETELSRLTAV